MSIKRLRREGWMKQGFNIMASYAKCLSFFFLIFLALCSSLQITQARDSNFFSKFSHTKPTTTQENTQSNDIPSSTPKSLALAPTGELEPELEPESESAVVEHGHGLYGRENYQYPPTTMDPVKNGLRDGEKSFVSLDEIRNEMNGNGYGYGYGYGYGNEKSYEGNENGKERQGMSDTRFLENGRYYYDPNNDVKEKNRYKGNYNGYVNEKQGMSDTKFMENQEVYPENNKKSEHGYGYGYGYETEKQGMSDTRFLENGRYYYDIGGGVPKGGNGESSKEDNNENELFETEEEMNEKYEKSNDHYSNNNNNNNYYENPNEQSENEHYVSRQGREGYNGKTKNLPPNQYDTMEEYEKEEEYRLSQQYQP